MDDDRIYLDWNATTPPSTPVIRAVRRALGEAWGNPSSHHEVGRGARAVVEEAREAVAGAIGGEPAEIVFTSGGTEAGNLAVRGTAHAAREAGSPARVVTVRTEHHCVTESAERLAEEGFEVVWLDVDRRGYVDPDAFEEAIREGAAVASVMLANNETGVLQDVPELARRARARGVLLHTDAVNALGKVPVDVDELGVDLLSLSGHKIRGPKGAGALWVGPGTPLLPLQVGGSHELERRGGTENAPGIAGLGAAADDVPDLLEATDRIRELRDRLRDGLHEAIPDATLHGDPDRGLPNTLNLGFPMVDGRKLLAALDLEGLAISGGSACASGAIEPSHVLRAMEVPEEAARSAVRFSLGATTTPAEVEEATEIVKRVVDRLAGD